MSEVARIRCASCGWHMDWAGATDGDDLAAQCAGHLTVCPKSPTAGGLSHPAFCGALGARWNIFHEGAGSPTLEIGWLKPLTTWGRRFDLTAVSAFDPMTGHHLSAYQPPGDRQT